MSEHATIVDQLLRTFGDTDYSASTVSSMISLCNSTRTNYVNNTFAEDEITLAAGANPILFATSWWWFRYDYDIDDYDFSSVDISVIQSGIDDYGAGTDPISIILEHWNPISEFDDMIANLSLAASMWKDQTTRPVGFYRIYPDDINNYYYPGYLQQAISGGNKINERIWRSQLSSIMKHNDRIGNALGQYVDYLSPRVYMHVHEPADPGYVIWKWASAFQILEAVRLANGKPVYPFVWFQTAEDNSNKILTSTEYTDQLKWISSFPGIDGIMLWDGPPTPTVPVDGYLWTDIATQLINGTAPFVDV